MPKDEFFYSLISGNAKGIGASLARVGLSLLSFPYWIGVKTRLALFRTGLYRVHKAECPVISVGNITAGGTGKTPFVEFLANFYSAQDIAPAILTRGYMPNAEADGESDEVLVYRANLRDVTVFVGRDRVRSSRMAEKSAGVILLDDGFQHLRLARNLNIVLLDAMNPFGYCRLLPRGLLREPLSSLSRADLIVLTRVDLLPEGDLNKVRDKLRELLDRLGLNIEVCEAVYKPESIVKSDSQSAECLKGRRIAAFCGLGNPDAFRRTLESLGAEVVFFRAYPDHHRYTEQDVADIVEHGTREKCDFIITTQKDFVKLGSAGKEKVYYLKSAVKILKGWEILEDKLIKAAKSSHAAEPRKV